MRPIFRREYHWRLIFLHIKKDGPLSFEQLFAKIRLRSYPQGNPSRPFVVQGNTTWQGLTDAEQKRFRSAFRDGLRYLRGRGVIESLVIGDKSKGRTTDLISLTMEGYNLTHEDQIPKLRQIYRHESKDAFRKSTEAIDSMDEIQKGIVSRRRESKVRRSEAEFLEQMSRDLERLVEAIHAGFEVLRKDLRKTLTQSLRKRRRNKKR